MKRQFFVKMFVLALLLYPLFAIATTGDSPPDSTAVPTINPDSIRPTRTAKHDFLVRMIQQEDNTIRWEEYSDGQLQDFINRMNLSKELYGQGVYVDWKRYPYTMMREYTRRYLRSRQMEQASNSDNRMLFIGNQNQRPPAYYPPPQNQTRGVDSRGTK